MLRVGLAGCSNVPTLLGRHRSHRDGHLFIDDGAGGRHDTDAGVSRHNDRQNERRETRADLHGHHRQLQEEHGPRFGIPGVSDYPVKIRGMNDARIVFDGSYDDGTSVASITGSIDRVTGDVEATDILSNTKTGNVMSSTSYALKCTPAQRMF